MDPSEHVHEWTDRHGRRWYVVAQYRDGRYYAPQRPESRKVTGCSVVFGDLAYCVSNAYCYRRRQDAVRRARSEFGGVTL